MEKTYQPHIIERRWYNEWEKGGYFSPQAHTKNAKPYCIVIPPPNITGTLHMGHAFQDTLMDALIRYHRMCGEHTLWQMGTDHAGIATQMVVERQLAQHNKTRHDLGRDAFVAEIQAWRKTSGGQISQQLRRLGTSVDWTRERFTMDDSLSHAVQHVFIRLYEEGLIYRGQRLVNWDPVLHTAISDLEVLSQEEDGHLWHIRYPLSDDSGHVTIATTRPETMLGDTAVAVHPEDPRYQHLIGKTIQLPLAEREIPIIADDYVEPEFGSGCVKITPGHDFNDYAVGQRHELPLINILTPDAHINDNAPEKYRGLDRYAARKKIVDDLTALTLIEKIEAHKLKVPRGDRSGIVIEPYLTNQWFVNMQPLAEPAIAAVKQGKIKFTPENWAKTYFQWLENIEDWCISRQLWWGHRIPAWYDNDGTLYVGESEAAIRKKHSLSDDTHLRQDDDVLDTWFSSALWPFSSLGWPEKTDDFKTFYPTQVLVTGFDIIFFWVARMVMMGLHFTGEIPFHEVYITGLIRDARGHKMSKSKGNIIDPIDLIDGIDLDSLLQKRTQNLMQPHLVEQIKKETIEQFPNGIAAHGTDALRFTLTSLASTGRDIRFDLGRLEGHRNFCNKIWNAARYVFMQTEAKDLGPALEEAELSWADRWILSRLQTTIGVIHTHFTDHRFDLLAQALHEFIWRDYCDWYLELSKPILYNDTYAEKLQCGTRRTLLSVLEIILRALHPIMPFITEEIWQRTAPLLEIASDTVMLQAYPQVNTAWQDADAETEIAWLQAIITGIRTIRAEMNIAPSKQLPVLLTRGNSVDRERSERHQTWLIQLARLERLAWLAEDEQRPPSATALAGELEILIPLAGVIDTDQETQRLTKEIKKLDKELLRAQTKLQNSNYLAKAPADIVAKEQAKADELQQSLEKMQHQLTLLSSVVEK